MCSSVIIDGKRYETQAELYAKTGVLVAHPAYLHQGQYSGLAPDTCLCPIDLDRVAAVIGMSAVMNHEKDAYVFSRLAP